MTTLKAIIKIVLAAAPHASATVEAALLLLSAFKHLKADDGTDVTPEQLAALWAEARAVAVTLGDEARSSNAAMLGHS